MVYDHSYRKIVAGTLERFTRAATGQKKKIVVFTSRYAEVRLPRRHSQKKQTDMW